MSRPTILVDIDNVVYDWVKAVCDFLAIRGVIDYGDRAEYMAKYKHWEVWEDWGLSKGEFLRWWRIGVEDGFIYRQGNAIKGARDALWRLSDAEWHIHLVTARLSKKAAYDKVVTNTADWLLAENIPYRTLTVSEKGSDRHKIMADVLVDDSKGNFNPDAHDVFFEFAAPHNGSYTTWENILEQLNV